MNDNIESEILVAKPPSRSSAVLNRRSVNQSSSTDFSGVVSDDVDSIMVIAMQILDDLHTNQIIRPLHASSLKLKLKNMVSKIQKTNQNISKMQDGIKCMVRENSQIEQRMKDQDELPKGPNSKVHLLRQKIFEAEINAAEIGQHIEILSFTEDALEEEKKILSKEVIHIPSKEQLRSQQKKLQRENDNAEAEAQKVTLENRRLCHLANEAEASKEEKVNKLTTLNDTWETVRLEFGSIVSRPEELRLNNCLLEKNLQEMKDKLRETTEELKTLNTVTSNLTQRKGQTEKEGADLVLKSSKCQAKMNDAQSQVKNAKRLFHEQQAFEAELMAEREKMKMDVEHLKLEKRGLLVSGKELARMRNNTLHRIRQADNALKALEEAVIFLQKTHDSLNLETEATRLSFGSSTKQTLVDRTRLTTEIAQFTRRIATNMKMSAAEQTKLQGLLQDKERLYASMDELRKESFDMHRLVAMKGEEGVQKQHHLQAAEQRLKEVRSYLSMQQLELVDNKKKIQFLQIQLRDFAKLYEAINVDRNECLMMISMAQQRKLELSEKMCLQANEMEILTSGVSHKVTQLQTIQVQVVELKKKLSQLRADISKQLYKNNDLKTQCGRISRSILHLQKVIIKGEGVLGALNHSYGQAVRLRNDCSIQLIERNEEVCSFQEKLRLLEAQERNANLELMTREDEFAVFRLQNREETRSIELLRGQISKRYQLEKDLLELNRKKLITTDSIQMLEKLAENPHALTLKTPNDQLAVAITERASEQKPQPRLRLLDGNDPEPDHLVVQMDDLNLKLAKKEAVLVERQLLLEATERMVSNIKPQAEEGSEEMLQLAIRVNDKQGTAMHTNKELKALMAELRTKIIEFSKLQKTAQHLEEQVTLARKRIAAGEPPTDHIDMEWIQMLRREQLQEELQQRMKENKERTGPSVKLTTAELRPNAYFPEGLEISILMTSKISPPVYVNPQAVRAVERMPKPFGGQTAPFKPNGPSGNMRHIRVPQPKPIEI